MSISLILATHSLNKITEMKIMFAELPIKILSGIEINLPETEENGATFEENALLKARSSVEFTNILSLSDDSGFCIPALDNFPGIYSKRWADNNYAQAFQKLTQQLAARNLTPPVPAFFQTVLALAWPDGLYRLYTGKTEGHFVMPPRPLDDQKRAYDPVFVPLNQPQTFGEMTILEKNQFSHRAQAVNALKQDFPWKR